MSKKDENQMQIKEMGQKEQDVKNEIIDENEKVKKSYKAKR